MKCELQPSLFPVHPHGPDQMQAQVLVQVPMPPLLREMVLLVELVPVPKQVSVTMPDRSVDQTNPLTLSVPNPQLDQSELLPLSVLEQLPVLDPLLKVVPTMISFLT